MDDTNPLPSLLTSVVVVDLKPSTLIQAVVKRLKAHLHHTGEGEDSLLQGFNQTEFEKLMAQLEGDNP